MEELRQAGVRRLIGEVLGPDDGPVWLAGVATDLVRDRDGVPGDLRPDESNPVDIVRHVLGVETLGLTDVQAETWASHENGVAQGYGDVVHLHLGVPAVRQALGELMDRPPRVLVSELDQFGAAQGAAQIAHHEVMQTMMSSIGGIALADLTTFRSLRARG